jgi:hypothetical protein
MAARLDRHFLSSLAAGPQLLVIHDCAGFDFACDPDQPAF